MNLSSNAYLRPKILRFVGVLTLNLVRHRRYPKGASLTENASFDVLIDKKRPAVFAVGDDKERERKGREGKGTYTKSQDVIFQLFVGGHPWDDSHKIGVRVAPHDAIKMSNFCSKIAVVLDLHWVKIPVFPLICWSSLQRSVICKSVTQLHRRSWTRGRVMTSSWWKALTSHWCVTRLDSHSHGSRGGVSINEQTTTVHCQPSPQVLHCVTTLMFHGSNMARSQREYEECTPQWS